MKKLALIPEIVTFLCLLTLFWGCGNSSTSSTNDKTYTVGGTIIGINGTLVLQNNGGNSLTRTTTGTFTFSSPLNNGTAYNVTISSQPSGQSCTVKNGSGTINAANVTNVQVSCTGIPYTVGGTVSGLSGTVTLQNNNGDDLNATANGSFTFGSTVTHGTAYKVTVSSQPSGQSCTVTNGSGTINAANVTDIEVECTDNINILTGYFMDGPVEGLEYSTATQSGYTDSSGAFEYFSGEAVSFYIGDVFLGQAIGASEITPFDLAGITPPQTNLEIVRTMNEVNRRNYGTPFEIAANIAVFLQTLDSDGVYSNGIQIPTQMHTLASGADINFTLKMSDFPNDFTFRKLIASGRSMGLWGGTRAIRKTGYALNSLYEGLEIIPDIYVNVMLDRNSNTDSSSVHWRYYWTYDANGNMTIQEYDPGADGTVNSRYYWTYDDSGNMTMEERDNLSLGARSRLTYTYDANGNRTMEEYYNGLTGTVSYRFIWTYDAYGNQTMWEDDARADGTVDWRYSYTYDSSGNLTMEEDDFDGDGSVDLRFNWTYDAYGNQTMKERDNGADGSVDERYIWTYDAYGNQTTEELNYLFVGTRFRSTYTYDANGNVTMQEGDSGADGTVEARSTYTYDANGNLAMSEGDSGADGTVDERWIWTYDANGNLTMEEKDYEADGTVDWRYTWTYDANGNITVEEGPADAYSVYDMLTIKYLYQTAGNGFMYFWTNQ